MKKSKWTSAQINLLLEKTKNGSIRTRAFSEVARATGRKPNSVRNFYYKLLETGGTAELSNKSISAKMRSDLSAHKKNTVVSFNKTDTNNLLREIVLGTSRGESVRSVCMNLAKGNKTAMLRFQNKYRAILAGNPARINETVRALGEQGFFVKNPVMKNSVHKTKTLHNHADNIIQMPLSNHKKLTDADINNLFMGLVRLVKRNANDEQVTTLRSQIDNLKSEIERLKNRHKTKATHK